ncbi:hypothetical protein PQZ60_gp05 [Klebsiella phage vB_KpnM_FZ14]|nr:hypothetical protein PQZ60_gp05 [Klebsiella phage vB_KpnM_FZ14]
MSVVSMKITTRSNRFVYDHD